MTEKRRSRARALGAALLLGLLGLLPGCSSLGESFPVSIGGLPADAPPRPANPPDYPAVHDMPPTRATPVLDEYSKKKLEDDLVSARDRQNGRKPAAKKPVARPAKQDAGATRNP